MPAGDYDDKGRVVQVQILQGGGKVRRNDIAVRKSGRVRKIFAVIEKREIAAYTYAMPICAELEGIWRLPYIYAAPETRGTGVPMSALCYASQMLLDDDKCPVITPWSPKTVEACEAMGYTIADNRLMGMGTRIES